MDPITLTITIYVADKLVSQFIKEEGYNRFKKFFFSGETYSYKLGVILRDVIEEYKSIHPKTSNSGKIYFFEDREVFDFLTQSIFFNKKRSDFFESLQNNKDIIPLTSEEINSFYTSFSQKVLASKELKKIKKLFFEERYQEEIFNISNELDALSANSLVLAEKTEQILQNTIDIKEVINNISEKFGYELNIVPELFLSTSNPHPLVEHISYRNDLISEYVSLIKQNIWLSIDGGIGMGKTQIAALIAEKFETVYWINLKNTDNENYGVKILYSIAQFLKIKTTSNSQELLNDVLEKIRENSLIVLDDLPKIADKTPVEFLRSFLLGCSSKNIKIVSTSNFEILRNTKELLKVNEVVFKKIPPLTEEEIYEVLISYSATEEFSHKFKSILKNVSQGHPTINSAICKFLKDNEWNISYEEILKIFHGDFSSELTENTYSEIEKTIFNEDSRELIYRLKVIIGNFALNDVKTIGSVKPVVKLPLEKFTSLIGSWIQKESNDSFQLSPLIKNLKVNNLSFETERKVNLALGKSILEKKKINQFEAKKAIGYFSAAKDFNNSGFVLILILNEALSNPAIYFDLEFHFYWADTKLPEEMDLYLRLNIRFLQILLCERQKKPNDFLINDLENLYSIASKKGINLAPAASLLCTIFAFNNKEKANYYFTESIKEFDKLKKENKTLEIDVTKFSPELVVWASAFKLKSREELLNWLDTVEVLSEAQRIKMLSEEISFSASRSIVGYLISIENSKPKIEQQWEILIDTFNLAKEKAKKLKIDILEINLIEGEIHILYDKLKLEEDALKLANQSLISYNKNSIAEFLICDSIGRMLFYGNRKEESKKYLTEAIQIDINESFTEKVDTYLTVAQLYEEENKELAHQYSERAYDLGNNNANVTATSQAKIIGEFAISLCQIGEYRMALEKLEEGFEKLINSYEANYECQATIVKYGNVLKYLYFLINDKNGNSNSEKLDDDFLIPKKGFFLKTNNKEIAEYAFFNATFFATAILFMNCFMEFENLILTKKWAFKIIEFSDKLNNNPYILLVKDCTTFLILEGFYSKAIERNIEIMLNTNKILENPSLIDESIDNKNVKTRLFKEEKKDKIPDLKTIHLDNIITILVIRTLNIIINEDDKSEIKKETEKLCNVLLANISGFEAEEVILKIVELVSLINTEVNSIEYVKIGNDYDGDNKSSVKLIAYLISSIFAPPKEALKIHLKLMLRLSESLKTTNSNAYIFIVLPFFEDFWLLKYKNNRDSFSEHGFWTSKSLPYFKTAKWRIKAQNLFKSIIHHLNYDAPEDEINWME